MPMDMITFIVKATEITFHHVLVDMFIDEENE